MLGLQQHCGWNAAQQLLDAAFELLDAVLQLLDAAFELLGLSQREYQHQRNDFSGQRSAVRVGSRRLLG